MVFIKSRKRLYGNWARFFLILHKPLGLFFRLSSYWDQKKSISSPRKILLCCWASLGDVFLATTFIDSILEKYPKATLGFLCGSQSIPLLEKNPKITHIHIAPSWRQIGKRKIEHILYFFKLYFSYYPKIAKEIQKVGYDISLELHPFFPDTAFLCRKAKIPHRIGFSSAGSEDSLTKSIDLPPSVSYLPRLYPLLIEKQISTPKIVRQTPDGQYIILHMGSSDPKKIWQTNYWYLVADALHRKGFSLVLTGSGIEDKKQIEQAKISAFANNLCDKLSIEELICSIAKASLLISVDSFPIHIAAQKGTPFIGLYLYNNFIDLWLPDTTHAHFLIKKDCNGEKRDPRIEYLEEITPAHVLSAASHLLRN